MFLIALQSSKNALRKLQIKINPLVLDPPHLEDMAKIYILK